MTKPDWKQAMLNEAEASENEQWATETRKEASGLRYRRSEARRQTVMSLLIGLMTVAALDQLPFLFGNYQSWVLILSMSTLLGLFTCWFAGQKLDGFSILPIVFVTLFFAEKTIAWEVQGWWVVAVPLAIAFGLGQLLAERWQPFGAWRPYDSANFKG